MVWGEKGPEHVACYIEEGYNGLKDVAFFLNDIRHRDVTDSLNKNIVSVLSEATTVSCKYHSTAGEGEVSIV